MSTIVTTPVPMRRPDLLIREVGPEQYVVKDLVDGKYFKVGPVEHFLLLSLDGRQLPEDVCSAFEARFSEPLTVDELNEFVELMRSRDLLAGTKAGGSSPSAEDEDGDDLEPTRGSQSWLFFRKSLFNPDRFLNAVEPRLRWIFTPTFVVLSCVLMATAFSLTVAHRHDLVSQLSHVGWSTAALAWAAVITVTMLHEFAHGLTCKHFGGEVREIGALVVFFTPCLFCNISDAWLMPKRSHRLWITFAGTYCDLCLWSLAVFVWRLTVPHSLINHLAWVILTICSGRILVNLNPFTRMDGYYLLSDIVGVPNLRAQARAQLMAHFRWILWGAERPEKRPRGAALLFYGFTVWAFSLFFLNYILFKVLHLLDLKSGIFGAVLTCVLVSYALRRVFSGIMRGELMTMIKLRKVRTAGWILFIVGLPATLFAVPMRLTANGEFDVRPGARIEIHSPVAGFVRRILVAEGDVVRRGQPLAELEVSDLESLIIRKEAEIRETSAMLTRLRAGARPEVLEERRRQVRRAEEWKTLAERDLDQARVRLSQDLLKYDLELKQFAVEIEFARSSVTRAEFLYKNGALAGEQLRSEKKKLALMESQQAQVQAQRRAREADGVRPASAELARRERDLAETLGELEILEAGARPEDIEAETAKLSRLEEERKFLESQKSKLVITAPAPGVIATPRMSEKVGQFADKGFLLCVLEDPQTVEVEIQVPEDDVRGIEPQQEVRLKSRALPLDSFLATVDRIAPTASVDSLRKLNSVRVYCHVDNSDGRLKSGMTGFARIDRGQGSAGRIVFGRILKTVRTEFWW